MGLCCLQSGDAWFLRQASAAVIGGRWPLYCAARGQGLSSIPEILLGYLEVECVTTLEAMGPGRTELIDYVDKSLAH